MKRSEKHKIRNGAVKLGNLAMFEAEARAQGEYARSQELGYVKERRQFERNLKLEQKARDARFESEKVIVRRRQVCDAV